MNVIEAEAIGGRIRSEPKDLEDGERTKREDVDVDAYVEERRASIRKGARRSLKRFRLDDTNH